VKFVEFGQSDSFLKEAALKYFQGKYEKPKIEIDEVIDSKLRWRPNFSFKFTNHLTILAEVSENPYPNIFKLNHAEINNIYKPISIFCVCPLASYLTKQSEVKKLRSHGYGLLTVDSEGHVEKQIQPIPLIQHIPENEFLEEIKSFPKRIRLLLKEAFDRYNHAPGAGIQELSQTIEGFIHIAGKKAYQKELITSVNGDDCASILDKMSASIKFKDAMAGIGGIRSYMKEYRNPAHHTPRNPKQAHKKYIECQHAFRDGIKKLNSFRIALKNLGININSI